MALIALQTGDILTSQADSETEVQATCKVGFNNSLYSPSTDIIIKIFI